MATQAELTALEEAINQGVRRVQYADKSVEYRSLDEMQRIRLQMLRELDLVKSPNRSTPTFCRGF